MLSLDARISTDAIRLAYCQRRIQLKLHRRPSEFFVLEFVSDAPPRFCLRIYDDRKGFQSVEGIAVPLDAALLHISEIYGLRVVEWRLCESPEGVVLFDDPATMHQREQKKMRDAFVSIISKYAQRERAYVL